MGLKKFEIEETQAAEITEEQAVILGRQVGIFLAAGLFSMETFGPVWESVKVLEASKFNDVFMNQAWAVLRAAVEPTTVGTATRADLAYEAGEASNSSRQRAAELALSHASGEVKGSAEVVGTLNDLLSTSDLYKKVSEVLFSTVRRNLDIMVVEGKKLALLNVVAQQVQSRQQDEEHDAKCDDPDCDCHTNH